jgi:hypothetical protein
MDVNGIMRRLTKSESSLVNTIFFVSLVSSLVACFLRPTLAWLRQSDIAFAVESSVISIMLWWLVLGIYRLSRG